MASRKVRGSTPRCSARATASARPASRAASHALTTSLSRVPAPTSPTHRTVAATGANTVSATAWRSSGPAANTVSFPCWAGPLVPSTGASTKPTPASAARAARRVVDSAPTVAICTQVAPGRADRTASAITDSVTGPSASIVTTTSPAPTASAGEAATVTPPAAPALVASAAARSALAPSRFQTVRGNPAPAKREAMAPPMMPVPRRAIEGASAMAAGLPGAPPRSSRAAGQGPSAPGSGAVDDLGHLPDLAVGDLDAAGDADALEQPAVVGDEDQGAAERAHRLLELLDGGQVEVVGGLVEDQQVDADGLEDRQGGPGPLAGRERPGGAGDVVGAEAELGQQGPGLRHRHDARPGLEAGDQGGGPVEHLAALADLADHDTRPHPALPLGERRPAQQRLQQRGLAGPVAPDDRQPVAHVDRERDRAEAKPRPAADAGPLDHGAVEPGDDVAAAAGVGDRHAQVPALEGLVDHVEPLHGPLGLPGLRRQVLGRGLLEVADELVALARRLGLADALGGPVPLGGGPVAQGVALVDVDGVGLLGVAPGPLPLDQERLPPAVDAADPVGVLVDLGDGGDGPLEEGAVVGHDDRRPGQAVDERLEPVEPVDVEVVRGLVEQEHVEAGQQQRRQLRPGGLPAGQRRHGPAQEVGRQPEVVGDGPGPGVEVGPAEGHPPVEGQGVGVVGPRGALRQGGGGGVERPVGLGDAGTPFEELADGLAGAG